MQKRQLSLFNVNIFASSDTHAIDEHTYTCTRSPPIRYTFPGVTGEKERKHATNLKRPFTNYSWRDSLGRAAGRSVKTSVNEYALRPELRGGERGRGAGEGIQGGVPQPGHASLYVVSSPRDTLLMRAPDCADPSSPQRKHGSLHGQRLHLLPLHL